MLEARCPAGLLSPELLASGSAQCPLWCHSHLWEQQGHSFPGSSLCFLPLSPGSALGGDGDCGYQVGAVLAGRTCPAEVTWRLRGTLGAQKLTGVPVTEAFPEAVTSDRLGFFSHENDGDFLLALGWWAGLAQELGARLTQPLALSDTCRDLSQPLSPTGQPS